MHGLRVPPATARKSSARFRGVAQTPAAALTAGPAKRAIPSGLHKAAPGKNVQSRKSHKKHPQECGCFCVSERLFVFHHEVVDLAEQIVGNDRTHLAEIDEDGIEEAGVVCAGLIGGQVSGRFALQEHSVEFALFGGGQGAQEGIRFLLFFGLGFRGSRRGSSLCCRGGSFGRRNFRRSGRGSNRSRRGFFRRFLRRNGLFFCRFFGNDLFFAFVLLFFIFFFFLHAAGAEDADEGKEDRKNDADH